MPLLNGRPVKFIPNPTDISQSSKVFQIRFTGEIFKEYTEYSARLDFYRQPKFSCKYTGKSGFNYENAFDHENIIKQEISHQIPSKYFPIILKQTQFSQLKLTDLVNSIAQILITEQNTNTQNTPNTQNTITNNNTNNNNNKDNKKPTKTPKCPIKKTLIRTFIRTAATQHNFKNAPWILNDDMAKKYNISTQIPSELQSLITQYLNNKNAPKKKRKKKAKSISICKSKSKSKSVAPQTLISALSIKISKQLKYPCDDQLLLMYDKHENNKIIAYDEFWRRINKIGIPNIVDNDHDDNNYSNLAFIDYNAYYYDENDDDDIFDIHHRQLNDIFSEIWNLWSFIAVYADELGITPFPISYLMDALCYNKRSILVDELQCCLLEIIRKHIISTINQRIEKAKHDKIKKKIRRKKAKKANKRAAKRKKLRKLQQEQAQAAVVGGGGGGDGENTKKSDKREMDSSDDDNNEQEDEEEEEEESEVTESDEDEDEETEPESELESESESVSESDSESEDIEITESDSDDISVMDIINSHAKYNALIFTTQPIHNFKLDLLRDYLSLRCNTKQTDENENENDENKMDIDDDEDCDIYSDEKEKERETEKKEEFEAILADSEYFLAEEIWNKLCNIRSYMSLTIEPKLEIFNILFKDVMSTCIIKHFINQRINKYEKELKYDIKSLDDEYSNMIKQEKHKLKNMRNELIEKKRILNPRKKTSKSRKKAASSSASSSSSSSTASAASKSTSNTPSKDNKENNPSGSNSVSVGIKTAVLKPRGTSRQQELLRKQQEQERHELMTSEEEKKEELKREIFKLENLMKTTRNLMDSKCKVKELEIGYKKYKFSMEYRTYLSELGSDRFHNKYFWSVYSDGRIFIFHSNAIYHKIKNNTSITKEMMKITENDMKCYNEWESMKEDENENGNKFCWSYISTSSEFYNLLSILDCRGIRECELLLSLNALKNDIIRSMKMVGNDDYKEPIIMMDVDNENENKNNNNTNNKLQLRRSKRATKQSIVSNEYNNHIQAGNKGFMSYRNKIKRK